MLRKFIASNRRSKSKLHETATFPEPIARASEGYVVGEPSVIYNIRYHAERRERVKELFQVVGSSLNIVDRYPHEFSGRQRQRIWGTKALVINPSFIVRNEPVSTLDVSIQAQISKLLQEIQEQFNLTYVFTAHYLSLVSYISDRVAVMYMNRIVEITGRDQLYENAQHPDTKALLLAVPTSDPAVEVKREGVILIGDARPTEPAQGMHFQPQISLCHGHMSAGSAATEGDEKGTRYGPSFILEHVA